MKSKKLAAVIAAAAMAASTIAALPAMAAVGDALISNGGAEWGGDNVLAYWYAKGNNDGGTSAISLETSTVNSGAQSVKVTDRTDANTGVGIYFSTQPTDGSSYEISVSIYPTEEDTFTVGAMSGYWKDTGCVTSKLCPANKWTTISFKGTLTEWNAGSFQVYSANSTADFYADDFSMVEYDPTASASDIYSQATWETALANGGYYNVTDDFTASYVVTADATTGTVNGGNHTITYTSHWSSSIYNQSTGGNWTYNDLTFSGGNQTLSGQYNRFLVFNDGDSTTTATLNNVVIKDAVFVLDDDSFPSYAITNRNADITLNNVTTENITYCDGYEYDMVCEWGLGTTKLTGVDKLKINTTAYYGGTPIDVTGLEKGSDVLIKAVNEELYNNITEQVVSDDLEMICDAENLTIHIKDKAVEPSPEPVLPTATVDASYQSEDTEKGDFAYGFKTTVTTNGTAATSITWTIANSVDNTTGTFTKDGLNISGEGADFVCGLIVKVSQGDKDNYNLSIVGVTAQ